MVNNLIRLQIFPLYVPRFDDPFHVESRAFPVLVFDVAAFLELRNEIPVALGDYEDLFGLFEAHFALSDPDV